MVAIRMLRIYHNIATEQNGPKFHNYALVDNSRIDDFDQIRLVDFEMNVQDKIPSLDEVSHDKYTRKYCSLESGAWKVLCLSYDDNIGSAFKDSKISVFPRIYWFVVYVVN
uniref:Uncharacterized protein n=1 Tax=Romanomermis culicivorax TaxID=13658 RepID=A0A915JEC7_ROMCU